MVENEEPCDRCAKAECACFGLPKRSCNECMRMKLRCSIVKIERAEQQIAKVQASVDGLRGLGVASSSRITILDADGSIVVEEAPPKR